MEAKKKFKTPVQILIEMMIKKKIVPDFELICNPVETQVNTFTYQVSCDGLVATGAGRSKKDAKHEAAKEMLDKIEARNAQSELAENSLKRSLPTEDTVPQKKLRGIPDSNAVGALIHLCSKKYSQLPDYKVEETGPPHFKIFCVTCTLSTFSEVGNAKTKKQAKNEAAKRMLSRIYEETVGTSEEIKSTSEKMQPVTVKAQNQPTLQTERIKEGNDHEMKNLQNVEKVIKIQKEEKGHELKNVQNAEKAIKIEKEEKGHELKNVQNAEKAIKIQKEEKGNELKNVQNAEKAIKIQKEEKGHELKNVQNAEKAIKIEKEEKGHELTNVQNAEKVIKERKGNELKIIQNVVKNDEIKKVQVQRMETRNGQSVSVATVTPQVIETKKKEELESPKILETAVKKRKIVQVDKNAKNLKAVVTPDETTKDSKTVASSDGNIKLSNFLEKKLQIEQNSPLMKVLQKKMNSNIQSVISDGYFKKTYDEETRCAALKEVNNLMQHINKADNEITKKFVFELRQTVMELLRPLKFNYKCMQLETKSSKCIMLVEISTNPDIHEVGIADSLHMAELNGIKQILQLLTKLM